MEFSSLSPKFTGKQRKFTALRKKLDFPGAASESGPEGVLQLAAARPRSASTTSAAHTDALIEHTCIQKHPTPIAHSSDTQYSTTSESIVSQCCRDSKNKAADHHTFASAQVLSESASRARGSNRSKLLEVNTRGRGCTGPPR
eukprot:7191063-Prymnesium_polylepis.1